MKFTLKEIIWEQAWFRRRWNNLDSQKRFLENLASQVQIQRPYQWNKMTAQHIQKYGGSSLLDKYNGSIFKALRSIYFGIFLYGNMED